MVLAAVASAIEREEFPAPSVRAAQERNGHRDAPNGPMVTYSGKPYVHLGMIRADAAERIAEAMRTPDETAE